MSSAADTIFAVATGGTRAAVSIVRVSGPATRTLLGALCGPLPAPRHASLRRLRARDGDVLDQGLVLWFPAPASYTGEDSAELHLHGGRAVLDGVSGALTELDARPAEPGEFTRRAFLNGKQGLLEAEAVADLIDAETQAQRRQAIVQLQGGLGDLYRAWAAEACDSLAMVEASIDFADEDGGLETSAAWLDQIVRLERAIHAHLADGGRGERLREGVVIAIVGPPNVGKSSLMNALAGEEVAIVAAAPGTTRDVLERRVTFGDTPVTLLDTAGLRDTSDPVEAEGIRRARQRASAADIVLRVTDAAMPIQDIGEPGDITLANKIDLLGTQAAAHAVAGVDLAVSAHTGFGMDALRAHLDVLVGRLTRSSGPPPLTRVRHRAALGDAARRLRAAAQADGPEIRAEELRLAVSAIGRVTGRVVADDVLDLIFARFCIGK